MNVQRAILVYLAGPRIWPTSPGDLAMELHASQRAVNYALRKLKEQGLVGCKIEGARDVWYATKAGREFDITVWDRPAPNGSSGA